LLSKSFGDKSIHYIHPSRVKSIMRKRGMIIEKGENKKEKTLEFVRKIQPGFPHFENRNGNTQPYCYDMADAYIVGIAGPIDLHEKVGKTSSGKKSARRTRVPKGR
jgi:hypothetical protein